MHDADLDTLLENADSCDIPNTGKEAGSKLRQRPGRLQPGYAVRLYVCPSSHEGHHVPMALLRRVDQGGSLGHDRKLPWL